MESVPRQVKNAEAEGCEQGVRFINFSVWLGIDLTAPSVRKSMLFVEDEHCVQLDLTG